MDIVSKIKNFVKEESKKPTSKYGYEPFIYHFTPVVKYARKLAKEHGADVEIVTLAGWLHDIGSITSGRKDHHLTGAKIAEEKLKELNYPAEKIEKVKNCILNHRGSVKNKCQTIEEQIIAEADAMSSFDNLQGLFKAAFVYEGLDQNEARKSVLKKYENKWRQLHLKGSKDILRAKYEAIKLLLE